MKFGTKTENRLGEYQPRSRWWVRLIDWWHSWLG